MATQVNNLKPGRRWLWGGSQGCTPSPVQKLTAETKAVRGAVTFPCAMGFALTLLAGCEPGDIADIHVEPLDHACAILERVDTVELVGFNSARIMPSEERNESHEIRISQCDHYAEDMSQRFSLIVRQDFSNRKLESGHEQLARLHDSLGRFAHDDLYWRSFDDLGEAAAWNSTANQLMIYWDQGHTMMAFSVYGTGDELQKTLDLADATMSETGYAK